MLYGLNMAKLNLISLKYGDFGPFFPKSIHNPHLFIFVAKWKTIAKKKEKEFKCWS